MSAICPVLERGGDPANAGAWRRAAGVMWQCQGDRISHSYLSAILERQSLVKSSPPLCVSEEGAPGEGHGSAVGEESAEVFITGILLAETPVSSARQLSLRDEI
jgi:hypothetical protein